MEGKTTLKTNQVGRVLHKTDKSSRKKNLKENLLAYAFLTPALIMLALFLIIPAGMVICYAFTNYYLLTPGATKFIGLKNFVQLFNDPIFGKSMLNILKFVGWIIPVQLGTALGLALIVNKARKGNIFFKVAFFAPVVTSLAVTSVLWMILYNPNSGLINAFLHKFGISAQPFLSSPTQAMYCIIFVSVWQGAGYQMLLFLAGMQNIPSYLYEAAEIDGFSKWAQFRYITMPLLKPTSIFILMTTLIDAFKLIVQPMIMTQGGPMNSTMTPIYYIFRTGFTDRMVGYSSSVALLFATLIGVITILQRKFIKEDE